MNCPSSENLKQLLTGNLAEPELEKLAEHVDFCAACQVMLGELTDEERLTELRPSERTRRVPMREASPMLMRVLMKVQGSTFHLFAADTVKDRLPAAPPALGPPLRDGDLGSLGPYFVRHLVGCGGMGIVLEAFDPELDRHVAIKMLRPERTDATSRARFVREAQAAARLTHPHIVTLHSVVNPPEAPPYLVMELVPGRTLREWIDREKRLNPNIAAELSIQIADGLTAAHTAGLVHRDIKPSNVLLKGRESRVESQEPEKHSSSFSDSRLSTLDSQLACHAIITDFGLARITSLPPGSTLTQEGFLAGTPAYMSPEQVRKPDRTDARSDVYSLGVTLYEMLTGDVPFHGEPHMVLRQVEFDEPRPPRKLNDAVPVDLETICLKAMAKEPERRYQSARELAEDLGRWRRGEPIHARPAGVLERSRLWARRNPRAALMTGTIAGLLLIVATGSTTSAILLAMANAEVKAQRHATTKHAKRAEQNAANARAAETRALESAQQAKQSESVAIAAAESATKQHTMAIETVNTLIFKVQEQLGDQAGTLKLKQQVLETALQKLEQIAETAEQSFESERKVGSQSAIVARRRLGDTFRTLGRPDLARKQYDRMLELCRGRLDADPENESLLDSASIAHNAIGQLLWDVHEFGGARDQYDRALAITQKLAAAHPDSIRHRRGVYLTRNNIADIFLRTGDYRAAIEFFSQSFSDTEQFMAGHPTDKLLLGDRGFLHSRLSLLYQLTSDFAEAAEHGRQALEISEQFAAEDPTSVNSRRAVLSARATLALLEIYQRNGAEALQLAESVLHDTAAAAASDPDNLKLLGEVASAWNTVGYAHVCRADYGAADHAWREMLMVQEKLLPRSPAANQIQLGMATTYLQLAAFAPRRERFDDALLALKRLFDLLAAIEKDGRLQDPLFRVWWDVREPLLASFRRINELGIESTDLVNPSDMPMMRAILLCARGHWLASHGRHVEAAQLADQAEGLVSSSALHLGAVLNVRSLILRTIDAEISTRPDDKSLASQRRQYAETAIATLSDLLQLDPSAQSRIEIDPEMWPVLDELRRTNATKEKT